MLAVSGSPELQIELLQLLQADRILSQLANVTNCMNKMNVGGLTRHVAETAHFDHHHEDLYQLYQLGYKQEVYNYNKKWQ